MSEQELFQAVLDNFLKKYPEVVVDHPYNDAYMDFSVNGKMIGGLNPAGHNLLYCLCELTKIYEFELY